jgi:hypothetical protein
VISPVRYLRLGVCCTILFNDALTFICHHFEKYLLLQQQAQTITQVLGTADNFKVLYLLI